MASSTSRTAGPDAVPRSEPPMWWESTPTHNGPRIRFVVAREEVHEPSRAPLPFGVCSLPCV
jgi:hypothetical protein